MLASGSSIGRYVVKRRLAEGGMAEVYLAQATGPEGFAKDVVIKVVRSFLSSDQQFIDMFINEARLSSRLNHANVVQIFDFGKHEQSYFIAMEYVRGASLYDLRQRCRDTGVPFPPTLVAEIGAQVARGLQYAHSLTEKGKPLGIVHRDVTPHNVLLSFDGAVKLTDFGIAKASTTHTAPGVLKGKFAYMAPEQARGEVVDARTDIFALGVVLWEMLTGGRLFDGDSELAVLRAVQESLIAPPTRLNPEVPHELSEIVLKALSRPPAERFQTAFDFDRALATFALRAARSVEDTSVSLFLQQLYRAELEADEQRPFMPIASAAVQRAPAVSALASEDTLAVDRSAELARGRVMPDGGAARAGLEGHTEPAARGPTLTEPLAQGRTDVKGADPRSPVRTDMMPAVSAGLRAPVRTDVMPAAAPSRTEQHPALSPSALGSGRTDQLPALAINTNIGQAPDKRTDPERKPLGSDPLADSSTIRVRDSVKLDVHRQVLEIQAAREAEKTGQKTKEPTVLKPRAISIEFPVEPSAPTAAAEPAPAPRSRGLMIASALVGVVVLGGAAYSLSRSATDSTPTVTPPVQELTVATPPKLEPVDAGVVVAALEPEPKPQPEPTPPEPAPKDPPVEAKPPEPVKAEPVKPEPVKPEPVKPEPAKVPIKARPAAVKTMPVELRVRPFAVVLLDGREIGQFSALSTIQVPWGKHTLTFKHPSRTTSVQLDIDGTPVKQLEFDANRQ